MKQQEKLSVMPKEDETPEGKKVILTDHLALLAKQWQEAHGNRRPPVVLDKDGNPYWLNRKTRRAQDAIARREAARLKRKLAYLECKKEEKAARKELVAKRAELRIRALERDAYLKTLATR